VLGKGGGYLCGPDHSIQKNMPPHILAALWDEARKLAQPLRQAGAIAGAGLNG